MNFSEYWASLFPDPSSTIGFIKIAGRTVPVRLSDRALAEHFWVKAGEECLKVVNQSFPRDGT